MLCDITDSVVEFNTLSERSRDLCKSDLEFYLVIEELVRQKKAVVHQDNSNIVSTTTDTGIHTLLCFVFVGSRSTNGPKHQLKDHSTSNLVLLALGGHMVCFVSLRWINRLKHQH